MNMGIIAASRLRSSDEINLFGDLSGKTQKWAGGVLAPNGKIYGIPANATQVLEIDPSNNTTSLFGSLTGNGKWAGGVLAPNGKIYGIPLNSTQILKISNVNSPNVIGSDANIPASLANLATSNYNEYYNKL